MALYKSETALGRKPVASLVNATGGDVRYEYVIGANLVAGDVIYMGDMPNNNAIPVDCALYCDKLDNGTTLTISAGVLLADKSALGAGANDTWISATTIGQTAGVSRPTSNAVMATGQAEFISRPLGIVINASATTPAMIGKKIVLVLKVLG